MSSIMIHLGIAIVALATLALRSQGDQSKLSFEANICRLLNDKFTASHPYTIYPVVFEPIKKGKLTIWSGVSTLPTSEFRCSPIESNGVYANSTRNIVLDFAGFNNKLEWTFYDANKGATYHGCSINSRHDVKYKVAINFRRADSYMECNTIESIIEINDEIDKEINPSVQTICSGCTQILLAPIESQIRELIKREIKEQILDNLYWQLTQLIINQHFHGPMPLNNNFD